MSIAHTFPPLSKIKIFRTDGRMEKGKSKCLHFIGQRCPHFSTFVKKSKFSGQMVRWARTNLNASPLLTPQRVEA